MNKLETVKTKIDELSKDLCELFKEIPSYYTQRLNELSKICELYNNVASLSNYCVAEVLMDTIKRIAYSSTNPNHEVICEYLEKAIADLMSGMDTIEMLGKYDEIYEVYYKLNL